MIGRFRFVLFPVFSISDIITIQINIVHPNNGAALRQTLRTAQHIWAWSSTGPLGDMSEPPNSFLAFRTHSLDSSLYCGGNSGAGK